MDDIRDQASKLPEQSEVSEGVVAQPSFTPEQTDAVERIAHKAIERRKAQQNVTKKSVVQTKGSIIGGKLHKTVGQNAPKVTTATNSDQGRLVGS